MAKASKKVQEQDSQGLAVAPTAALPAIAQSDWGSEGLTNSDMLVPKILLMQGLSDLVSDGLAVSGQLRDSLEGRLFGGMMKPKEAPVPMEVIPFSTFRTWVIFEKKNGKDEYVKTVPITPENEGLAISEVVGGIEIRRDKCLNFYVLRPEEIKDGVAFPYIISFRRTSMPAGKKLATLAAKLRVFKRPLASKIVNLGVSAEENDKGKYFVLDVAHGRDSTAEELAQAYHWHNALKTASVVVDDSDLKRAEAAPRSASLPDDDLDI